MAYNESCRAVTAIAGDSGVSKYHFVVIASDGQADHAGTAQVPVDGVCGMDAAAGETFPMNVADGGIVKIELAATLAAGALVATNNAGEAIAHGSTAGDVCCGKLLEGGDDGDVVSMQFIHKLTAAGS